MSGVFKWYVWICVVQRQIMKMSGSSGEQKHHVTGCKWYKNIDGCCWENHHQYIWFCVVKRQMDYCDVHWMVWCLMVKGQSMTKDGCEWCKSTAWGLPYKDGLNGAMIWHEDGMV